jgi:hypothetical protein
MCVFSCAAQFEEGTITYVKLGKDMVLEMRYKGRNIKGPWKHFKSSKIDLVLGDGKMSYEEEIKRTLNQQKKCQMNNNESMTKKNYTNILNLKFKGQASCE